MRLRGGSESYEIKVLASAPPIFSLRLRRCFRVTGNLDQSVAEAMRHNTLAYIIIFFFSLSLPSPGLRDVIKKIQIFLYYFSDLEFQEASSSLQGSVVPMSHPLV